MNKSMTCTVLLLMSCVSWAANPDAIDDYISLATGEFSSAAQARIDTRYDAVTWHVAEIWVDTNPHERWLYVESWMDGADAPYMQRISRVTQLDDGGLLARRYRIPEPHRFVRAWEDVRGFAALKPADLIELSGCDAVLVRTGSRRFEGGTQGNSCRNTHRGASYAVSYGTLMEDGMVNWDRGIAANGEQVWGPSAGGYQFERVGAGDGCNRPVQMLVYGTISDREKFIAYGQAIADSGLYDTYNGYYESTSPALDVFEGDPPRNRGVLIARFPCLEAAQGFWKSDAYERIKPMRDGIAEFEVLVLKPAPVPEWID